MIRRALIPLNLALRYILFRFYRDVSRQQTTWLKHGVFAFKTLNFSMITMGSKTTLVLLLIASLLIIESTCAPAKESTNRGKSGIFSSVLHRLKRTCTKGDPCSRTNPCYCEGEDLVCEYVDVQPNPGYKCVSAGNVNPI